MISAGRVLLMPKGDYDPTATYEMLDIVSYNGSSYIAKGTTTGNLPTNTTYWQLSAYGGQAANLAGNFAPLETTAYATRAYVANDIFVDKDSQLVIATTTINIGDEIEIGSNCDTTTMAELLDAIENRYDALDQRNRKLVGINPITIQTDLHLLAPGEYFKKLTNFYVTNAPTGINQVPAAIFRLTVESGLDESGSSLLLTLRTIEGEIYTQAYDGSVWSDWRKAGDVDSSNLGTAAIKDSTNEVTSGSTDLVESGAVYSELELKADSEKAYQTDDTTETTLASDDIIPFYDTSATAKRKMTVQKFGEQLISNPNLLDNPWFTVNQRGQSSYSNVGYTVDRWLITVNTDNLGIITVNSDGITNDNTNGSGQLDFRQIVTTDRANIDLYNSLLGKTVTLSIMFTDGTVESATGIIPSNPSDWTPICAISNSTKIKGAVALQMNSGATYVTIGAWAGYAIQNIKAIKLELGSVSTLAMDTAPNYATELLKCQRYFVRYLMPDNSGAPLGIGFYSSTTNVRLSLTLPIEMRAKPTVNISDISKFKVVVDNAAKVASAVSVSGVFQNIITLNFTTDSATQYAIATLNRTTQGEYIDLSADL